MTDLADPIRYHRDTGLLGGADQDVHSLSISGLDPLLPRCRLSMGRLQATSRSRGEHDAPGVERRRRS